MEFNGFSLLLVLLVPIGLIIVIILAIAPLINKSLSETASVRKRYLAKLNGLTNDFQVSSNDLREQILVKKNELHEGLRERKFNDADSLHSFAIQKQNEIQDLLNNYRENVDEHLHEYLTMFQESITETKNKFYEESGYSETQKLLKTDIRDLFK